MCKTTRSGLTIFPSDCVRGFCLSMSCAVSMSADRTLVWASQHLVRGCGVWRAIAHLVVTVKAAGLALWLRFMGLDWIKHGRKTCWDVLELTLMSFPSHSSYHHWLFQENTVHYEQASLRKTTNTTETNGTMKTDLISSKVNCSSEWEWLNVTSFESWSTRCLDH